MPVLLIALAGGAVLLIASLRHKPAQQSYQYYELHKIRNAAGNRPWYCLGIAVLGVFLSGFSRQLYPNDSAWGSSIFVCIAGVMIVGGLIGAAVYWLLGQTIDSQDWTYDVERRHKAMFRDMANDPNRSADDPLKLDAQYRLEAADEYNQQHPPKGMPLWKILILAGLAVIVLLCLFPIL